MSYPAITLGYHDTLDLRAFLARPNGSMVGRDLTVDAVEGGGAMLKLHPRWTHEPSRVAKAERLRYTALHCAYRALRDLGDTEGAALLNELANKEWDA